MPSPVARFRWLRAKLHSIRNGTGAAIFPPNVSKLVLSFNYKASNGHMSAKKFYRECLPRLKYHNPTVEMPVTRLQATEGPATLTIHFCDPSVALKFTEPPPTPSNTSSKKKQLPAHQPRPVPPETISTVDIDLLNRLSDDIMNEIIEKTSATLYEEAARSDELDEEAAYLAEKREKKLAEKYKLQRSGRKEAQRGLAAEKEILAAAAI
ncbi:hypothetical protein ABW20_dc0110286 [Dactylellina cionopaga]|nr:hypothetical protein ABW20_dc0110286 [Dactylellina cionopaga]